ncbi:hypothetical protein WR25_18046 isoform C [Diploscapter pachys]|nr:hypothetical protein WR25_18046 isoform C [Diploscapter pachys]
MIQEAIASIKDRKGASRQAIKAFITEKYMLDDNTGNFTRNLNNTLKKGVTDGTLKQVGYKNRHVGTRLKFSLFLVLVLTGGKLSSNFIIFQTSNMSSKIIFESLIAFQPYGNQGRFGLGEAAAKKKRATKAESSHSGSLDKKKKTKSAGSASSIPKAKSAPKTKTTGTTKKTAATKSTKSPAAKSTETTKKASAKAKTSTKTVKTAKENKGKKTAGDTQPSKKATTKAQPKAPAVSKKASSTKKPSTKTNA